MGTDTKPISFVMIVAALCCLAFPARAFEDTEVCGAETARQERAQAIPTRLLHAISLVESGRWDGDRKQVLAWPWTVMAEGEGRFLPSKSAAIAEVRKLQARGVKNIDVGCMQVNLLAHPTAFTTLEDAFEPEHNVAYAAQFLTSLHDTTGDWQTAGAYYHSQTPDLAATYKAKLIAVWDKLKSVTDNRLQAVDQIMQNRPPLGVPMFSTPSSVRPAVAEASIAAIRASQLVQSAAERAAAQRAANAYRQAKIEEYRQRKALLQPAARG